MLGCLVIGGTFVLGLHAAPPRQAADPGVAAPSSTRAVLDEYRVACHKEKARVGELVLEHIDATGVRRGAATWERVGEALWH